MHKYVGVCVCGPSPCLQVQHVLRLIFPKRIGNEPVLKSLLVSCGVKPAVIFSVNSRVACFSSLVSPPPVTCTRPSCFTRCSRSIMIFDQEGRLAEPLIKAPSRARLAESPRPSAWKRATPRLTSSDLIRPTAAGWLEENLVFNVLVPSHTEIILIPTPLHL